MIEFAGVDIVAERRIDETTLRRTLAEVFSVLDQRIVAIGDVAEYPATDTADIVCVRTQVDGQFAEILSIQCDKLVLPQASVLEVFALVAARLQMRCLMPDDSLDPFMMWCSSAGMKPELVALDPLALDAGRYEIAGRSL